MLDTRRYFLKKAITTAGGLAAASVLPRLSYAGCTSSTRNFEFTDIIGSGTFTANIPDWKVGDCELKDSSLTLTPGNFIIFKGQVATHHTHTKDVWHFHLQLFTRNNPNPSQKVILFDRTFDGPNMSEQDKPLFHTWTFRSPFNPRGTAFRRIAAEVISCC